MLPPPVLWYTASQIAPHRGRANHLGVAFHTANTKGHSPDNMSWITTYQRNTVTTNPFIVAPSIASTRPCHGHLLGRTSWPIISARNMIEKCYSPTVRQNRVTSVLVHWRNLPYIFARRISHCLVRLAQLSTLLWGRSASVPGGDVLKTYHRTSSWLI